jgi:hypothetical protein
VSKLSGSVAYGRVFPDGWTVGGVLCGSAASPASCHCHEGLARRRAIRSSSFVASDTRYPVTSVPVTAAAISAAVVCVCIIGQAVRLHRMTEPLVPLMPRTSNVFQGHIAFGLSWCFCGAPGVLEVDSALTGVVMGFVI